MMKKLLILWRRLSLLGYLGVTIPASCSFLLLLPPRVLHFPELNPPIKLPPWLLLRRLRPRHLLCRVSKARLPRTPSTSASLSWKASEQTS